MRVHPKWVLLAGAIGSEVTATLAMRAAVDAPAWYALVAAGYVTSLVLISRVLTLGVPLGVAYGIWGAVGVIATATLAVPIYGDGFSPQMAVGVLILIAGVLLVELGHHNAPRPDPSHDRDETP